MPHPWPSYSSFPIKTYNNNATSITLSPSPVSEIVVYGLLLRGGDCDDGKQCQQRQRQRRRDDDPRRSHHILSSHFPFDNIQQHFSHARDRVRKLPCANDDDNGSAPTPRPFAVDIAARLLAGTVAFYATAFSSQYIQYKLLKISTGTQPGFIPLGCGMITVALGSWAGHLAGLGVAASSYSTQKSSSFSSSSLMDGTAGFHNGIESIRNAVRQLPEFAGAGYKCASELMRPMMSSPSDSNDSSGLTARKRKERREAWMHAARICILGLFTYKTIFRSHFASLSPSSYTARGSFARIGLPAPSNFNYATPAQRAQLERIGRWWGCHTCGSRMIFSNSGKNALVFGGGGATTTMPKFHGDHVPPVSVAKQINNRWHRRALGWKVKQRFYPQCRICSNKQGGLLSRAVNAGHRNLRAVGGGEESFFHGRRWRVGHLTGGVVAVLSIGSTTAAHGRGGEAALVKASRERMLSFQKWCEDVGRDVKERLLSSWK